MSKSDLSKSDLIGWLWFIGLPLGLLILAVIIKVMKWV